MLFGAAAGLVDDHPVAADPAFELRLGFGLGLGLGLGFRLGLRGRLLRRLLHRHVVPPSEDYRLPAPSGRSQMSPVSPDRPQSSRRRSPFKARTAVTSWVTSSVHL